MVNLNQVFAQTNKEIHLMSSKRNSLIKRTPTTYNISNDILAKIGCLTYDSSYGRAKYGLKSLVVEELLQAFFKAHITGQKTINIEKLSKIIRS